MTDKRISLLRVGFILVGLLAAAGCTMGPTSVAPVAFDFDVVPDRVWIGPEFHANRLQDWRVEGGRMVSVEGRVQKPMRTVHLLTHWLSERAAEAEISVELGLADGETFATGDSDSWAGFLIGAGGTHVDFRISALTHHWPAEDGGLVVAVDGSGDIVVRDNSVNQGYRRPVGDIPTSAWPIVEPDEHDRFGESAADALSLSVRLKPNAGDTTYTMVVGTARIDGMPLSRATYENVPAAFVDGNVALAAHRHEPGLWFNHLALSGSKLMRDESRAVGPVIGAFHTLSGGTLKMTAQFGPIGADDALGAKLEIQRDGEWVVAASSPIGDGSYTATFRVDDWDATISTAYRVAYDYAGRDGIVTTHYPGTIRAEPRGTEFVLAAMNCQNMSGGEGQWNGNHFWYPHAELAEAVAYHQPDMLFFAGDQIYEAGLEGVERSPVDRATLDYLNHWYRFVISFRELARDIPTVIIPDDHDVYHGNVWGNAGVRMPGEFSPPTDAGGYTMPPGWVNMVHRTQVSHLPDPVDPQPIAHDISVYHTRVEYGGVSFAVLADRMWKSPPVTTVPAARVWNGWPQVAGYDATRADVPGARLLGARQLGFLETWATDWSADAWMKVVLSQTLFSNLATIPDSALSGAVLPALGLPRPGEYQRGDKIASDMDSNGWPQTGRNEALRRMRKGFAFHIAGDQHLGSYVHYGIDDFGDAGNAFVVPSIANIWPRRWFPPEPGKNRLPGAPEYTGDFHDGFGNKMTVRAVANPVATGLEPAALYDRSPGYGIIRFDRVTRKITSEAWPRWVDPSEDGAAQYLGWPVTIDQSANYGRQPVAYLDEIEFDGDVQPWVQVVDEESGEVVYAVRPHTKTYRPPVFDAERTYVAVIKE